MIVNTIMIITQITSYSEKVWWIWRSVCDLQAKIHSPKFSSNTQKVNFQPNIANFPAIWHNKTCFQQCNHKNRKWTYSILYFETSFKQSDIHNNICIPFITLYTLATLIIANKFTSNYKSCQFSANTIYVYIISTQDPA